MFTYCSSLCSSEKVTTSTVQAPHLLVFIFCLAMQYTFAVSSLLLYFTSLDRILRIQV